MTETKKDKVLGGGAIVIALLTLVWSQISDSSSELNAAIGVNRTEIHSNTESIHELRTYSAVNKEQHRTMIEKLDKLYNLMQENK